MLFRSGDALIGGSASIQDSAFILSGYIHGNAQVIDSARVAGNANISGHAIVSGNACVEGNAIVTKNTINISGFPYNITITDNHLRIWLEQHTFDEWRMFDDKGGFIYNSIQAVDIVDEPEIWIEAGSLFRDETADRDQKIMDLMQAGLIDKDTAVRELSFKTGGGYLMDQIANRNHALEMLEGVKQGAQVEIFSTDDLSLI